MREACGIGLGRRSGRTTVVRDLRGRHLSFGLRCARFQLRERRRDVVVEHTGLLAGERMREIGSRGGSERGRPSASEGTTGEHEDLSHTNSAVGDGQTR